MKAFIVSLLGRISRLCLVLMIGTWAHAAIRVTECESVFTFGTGRSDTGAIRPGGADPYFDGITRNFPSGSALVVGTIPTGWLPNASSPDSSWIGPAADGTSAAGTYIYRLTVVTPCAGADVRGRFAVGDRGGITINGVPSGIVTPSNGAGQWTAIAFNNLPKGTNRIDFVCTNTPTVLSGESATGLRAEVTITATCCECIVLSCPSDIRATTCSNSAPVQFSASAVNHCGPAPTITFNPPSGSLFTVGSHSVVCDARDNLGHATRCVFKVDVVREVSPPIIQCPPGPIVLKANADCRAILPVLKPTLIAACAAPGDVTLTQTPPAETVLGVGSHTVKLKACRAGSTLGSPPLCDECEVIVQVCAPPRIQCPGPITVNCASGDSVVNFSVLATDPCGSGAPLPVTCVPPSGSLFPVGTTTVTCTAGNNCGQISTCSFTVTVTGDSLATTYSAGIDDSFASPTEAAAPGACLGQTGWIVGKPFDDINSSRRWAHTFGGLPNNIVAAQLTIAMEPLGPFAGLDRLYLGLTNCSPAAWAAIKSIPFLPGANGTWSNNGRVVFTLDLAALPGGGNILAALNAAHRLDLVTDPATRVDFCRLEIRSCGPGLRFSRQPLQLTDTAIRYTPFGIELFPPSPERQREWHFSTDLPIDIGDILQFDFPTLSCNTVGSHEGLVTDWKPNEETVATLKFTSGNPASRTEITMNQLQNTSGKSVEVYKNGQLVSRRYYPGAIPSGVSLPDTTCLQSMGFSTSAFFASFEAAVPVTFLPGGNFISGDPSDTVTGDRIQLGFVIFVTAPGNSPMIDIGGILPLLQLSQIRTIKNPITLPAPCVQIECPIGLVAPCDSLAGSVVNFTATAKANCGRSVNVTCIPPSGSIFPPGATWVVCVAQDELGNQDHCTFPIIVRDTVPPVIRLPRRVATPCTSPIGAVVEYAVGATDNCGNVKLDCQPPSGSVFPIGTTLVKCVATDDAGNQSTREFPVVVIGDCGDQTCLAVKVPDDLRVPCNTPGGAVVRFDTIAKNLCAGGVVAVTCVPPSGSVFPVGLTAVLCTAKSGDTEAKAAFMVEVIDETPPEITCPANLEVKAQNGRGALVRFAVTAKDDCTANPWIHCQPPSGSVFPVGETVVHCEARDGHGNVARCSFAVNVLPPKPVSVQLGGLRGLRLRWTGDAQPQFLDTLDGPWKNLPEVSLPDGDERVLDLDPTAAAQFFRVLPRPLAPEPDRDGDGVPDARDLCPDTAPGTRVDSQGCALEEIVEKPTRLAAGFDAAYAQLLQSLRTKKILEGLAEKLLLPPKGGSNDPIPAIGRADFAAAKAGLAKILEALRHAQTVWPDERAARTRLLAAQASLLDATNADVRDEDHEVSDLDDFALELQEASDQADSLMIRLMALRNSQLGKQRVKIAGFDQRRGVLILADGRRVLVRLPGGLPDEHAFGPGSEVELDLQDLGEGALAAIGLTPIAKLGNVLPPGFLISRLRFRLVPTGESGPLDTGIRLNPRAYLWGFTEGTSQLYLEKGMAVAAEKANLPDDPSQKSWLRIRVDKENDGIYATSLVEALDETDEPRVLPATLPNYKFMGIEVAEMRAPVTNGVVGTPVVVRTETYTMQISEPGDYAEAVYNRTTFELPDVPSHAAFQKARVQFIVSRFPLTLANDSFQFLSSGFGVSGNSSTYPDVKTVGLNQDFAVHWDEPAYQIFGSLDQDVGTALASSVLIGKRHGHTYVYRCRTPHVVHDRIHACTGVDSYYRIPFFGPVAPGTVGGWSVSQGNNGSFTHKGDQKYAFDFPAPAGQSILAARGGRVLFVRNTACFSCWNPNANGGKGACQNCTGTAAANTVTIQHDDGTRGRYFHFQKGGVNVTQGKRVYRGDILGQVGTTGCSTGNHLHFDVTENSNSSVTIPIRFEAIDADGIYHDCYLPPSNSDGLSTNKPWFWPF